MSDADPSNPPAADGDGSSLLDRAADWLRAGRVVGFPTETVYGLGASALDERAVALVFALKGRPSNNPLIVHVSGVAMARGLCREWPERAGRLVERFWPGPLTLVLPRSSVVPGNVTAGGGTVALRMPDHPIALGLIERFGGPIVGPSANRSGMVSPTMAAHVREVFGDDERVMILDGGACVAGIESTVVSLAGERACVLRRGVIGAEEIAAVIDEVVEDGGVDVVGTDPESALASPGMLSRHYAPRTPAVLVVGGDEPAHWSAQTGRAVRIAVIGSGIAIETARGVIGDALVHGEAMPGDAVAYAHRLYAALRCADDAGAGVILIEHPAGEGAVWDAIRDRLRRATTREH